jgi:tetratricopeptide (TPR) repeat protein
MQNIAEVYRQTGQPAEAVAWSQRSLALSRELGHRNAVAANLGNLGLCSIDLGELDAAVAYLTDAMRVHQELGQQEGVLEVHLGLAEVHRRRHEPMSALRRVMAAARIATELGNRRLAVQVGDVFAAVLEESGHPGLAERVRTTAARLGG